MIEFLDILYLSLATYAIAFMVTQTAGPGDMFSIMRENAPAILRRLLTCYYCLAVWVALILMLIYVSEVGRAVTLLFAVTGVAYIAYRIAK